MGSSHFQDIEALIAGARATVAQLDDRHSRSPQARGARPPRGPRASGGSAGPSAPRAGTGADTGEELLRAAELVARQLRRALDLSAVAIFLLHGNTGVPARVAFPILGFNERLETWPQVFERTLPGVAQSCPAVERVIARHQYGGGPENTWLPMLERLSEATRSRPLRDRDELEQLIGGAPVVAMLQRMVARSAQLTREMRSAATSFR